jgi:hypothetical protein
VGAVRRRAHVVQLLEAAERLDCACGACLQMVSVLAFGAAPAAGDAAAVGAAS